MADDDFYKRYKPLHEALMKMSHEDLAAVAMCFEARYPLENVAYSKEDAITGIWSRILEWRNRERDHLELCRTLSKLRPYIR